MVIATSAAASSPAANVRLTYGSGGADDAALFERMQERLAAFIGTCGVDGALMGAQAIRTCKKPTFTEPKDLEDNATTAKEKKHDRDWEKYFDNVDKWEVINPYIFNYILRVCDDRLLGKLRGLDDYADIKDTQDGIRLLELIRSICHRREEGDMSTYTLTVLDLQIVSVQQKEGESNAAYDEGFRQRMAVADANGAKIGSHQETLLFKHLKIWAEENGVSIAEGIEKAAKDKAVFTDAVITKAQQAARDEYRACLFLALADRKRYGTLLDDLRKRYLLGEDLYPKTITAAVRLMDQYEQGGKTKTPAAAGESLAFVQPGHEEEKKDDDGASADHVPVVVPTDPAKLAAYEIRFPKKHTPENDALWDQFNSFAPPDKKKFWRAHRKLRDEKAKSKAKAEESGEAHVNVGGDDSIDGIGFAEMQASRSTIMPDDRAHVDTCASHHSSHAPQHLDKVRPARVALRSHCNAGTTTASSVGNLGPVELYVQSTGIATLLSVPQLERDGCRVERVSGVSTLNFPCGIQLTCKEDDTGVRAGMPYVSIHDLKKLPADAFQAPEGVTLVQTVSGNIEESGLTPRQVKRAYLAAELQAKTGHHTDETFTRMVSSDGFRNSPITVQDISHMRRLFGPKSLAELRGRSTRVTPDRVENEIISIPRDYYELHKFVTLCADVMFVNGVAFLSTFSRDIRFFTAEHVPSRTAKQLGSSLKKIIRLYAKGGFVVRLILMDGEFAKVEDELPLVQSNTAATQEHVAEIERGHRTIKERARCVVSELPFAWKCLHQQIIIHLVYYVVKWINAVPAPKGISEKYSPREIVTQRRIDVAKDAPFRFGTNVEGSDDDETTNTMKSRTRGGIFLGTSNNLQRTPKIFDIATGKVVTRRTCTEVPMPGRVISAINQWGRRNKKEKYGKKLEFLNRRKQAYDWTNDELDPLEALAEAEEQKVHDQPPAELPGIPLEEDIPEGPAVIDDPADTIEANAIAQAAARCRTAAGVEHAQDMAARQVTFKDVLMGTVDQVKVEDVVDDDDEPPAGTTTPAAAGDFDASVMPDDSGDAPPPQPSRYPSRPRTAPHRLNINHPSEYSGTKSYEEPPAQGVIHATVADEVAADFQQEADLEFALGVALVQTYNLKQGLKLFGKRAEDATTKEFTQLHDTESFIPMDAAALSYEERREALNALLFLTEKRDGKIKARVPVDGSPQRKYMAKHDAASPTVANEAVKLTCAQEAHEGRCVKVVDCPGAFLKADLDDHVIMVFRGRLAELMAEVAPKLYRKYIILGKNGEPLLYVKLKKALYGLLQSALLFYKKLVADLKADGFELNPYDPCVANKMVNGKQLTVAWHVDDLKISHFEEAEVDRLISYLKSIYGENLSEQEGPVVDYLGTHYYYPGDGTVQMSQIPYIDKIFEDFPEQITSTKSTPAADHLFKVRDEAEAKFLDNERADAFHHATAQLAFLRARSRPDIDPAVAFLTTRVRKPDEDDWGKLKRVLQYLKGTKYMKLTISVDSLTILNWWVDASYSIHEDCKGHTGVIMSLGKGGTLSASWKQKINVRSSTEGELVGLDDALPLILWTRYFMEAQGYTIEHNIVRQDNKSTLLLARNGRFSSGKRTKHIKARYFNIADKVSTGDIEMAYEPTESMWADVLNKPKQGKAFREFRAFLMNVPANYDDDIERIAEAQQQSPDRSSGGHYFSDDSTAASSSRRAMEV